MRENATDTFEVQVMFGGISFLPIVFEAQTFDSTLFQFFKKNFR